MLQGFFRQQNKGGRGGETKRTLLPFPYFRMGMNAKFLPLNHRHASDRKGAQDMNQLHK